MTVWNADQGFARLPRKDTQNLKNKNYSKELSGSSWGLQGRTFKPAPDGPLSWQRYIYSGSGLYMYGKEERGRWGFVRCIQGDVWGGLRRPPNRVSWNTPPPLSIQNNTLRVKLNFYNDTSSLGRSGRPWVMHAINVWVSSSSFPLNGKDRNGKKPLVLDLAFYHSGSSLRSHQSAVAYHYQASVGNTPAKQRRSYYFNLSQYIQSALNHFRLPQTGVKLYQLEFLIELKNAEGAAKISNFELQY